HRARVPCGRELAPNPALGELDGRRGRARARRGARPPLATSAEGRGVTRPRRRRPPRMVVAVGVPLALGVALVAVVIRLAGPAATFDTLGRLRAWQGAVLVAAAFANSFFGAVALHVILRRYGHRVPVWLLFRVTILVFAVGWLVPSGYVAGFPVGAYVLRRRGVPFGRALAALLIERFFEIAVYALVLPTVLMSALPAGAALFAGVFAPRAAPR